MAPLTLPIKCIMEWNNNKVTDHNRDSLSVDIESIMDRKRMANGTLRQYWVADKRTFSTSWKELPATANDTVDGFWGGREMYNFYKNTKGSFTLKLNFSDNTSETVTVVFSSFDYEITKRGAYDFWQASVTLEEV